MTDFFNLYFQIEFIATRGSGFRGDIAIDNVQLTDGLCGKSVQAWSNRCFGNPR